MSSLFILLLIIAAFVSAPLLIVMLVVKLTEAEHQKKAREKIAEEKRLLDENVVAAQLSAATEHNDIPGRNENSLIPADFTDVQQPARDIFSTYTPNHIPASVRTESIVLSLFLIGYGAIGWVMDGLYLPAKRGGFIIHGLALKLMFFAMICAALNLAAVVIDHYDQRNNERHYIAFSKVTRFFGWTLFTLALAVDLFDYGQSK